MWRGGTDIPALIDARGILVGFLPLGGGVHELTGTESLLKDVSFEVLIANKAYDADWLLAAIARRKAKAVISPRFHRKKRTAHDKEMYKKRHTIENFFARIKEYRE